jgi:hypothetical protein
MERLAEARDLWTDVGFGSTAPAAVVVQQQQRAKSSKKDGAATVVCLRLLNEHLMDGTSDALDGVPPP